MIYVQLFLSFLQIGAFSFGGGYAAMPLIQEQIVERHPWLSIGEFTDLITLSQMTPGPIAVNSATFVGVKLAGIPGAIAATAGCILPSCILVVLLAKIYLKYRNVQAFQSVLSTLRPVVVAMIANAGISILISAFWGENGISKITEICPDMVVIFVVAFYLLKKKQANPILVMIACGVAKAAESGILSLL